VNLRYNSYKQRAVTDHSTPLAIRLADLEDMTGIDAEHLAQLIGVDGKRYRLWALGQLRQVGKFKNRCEHIEALAKTGLRLTLATLIDWEDGRIYWSLGNITHHPLIADAAKSDRTVTDHSGPLVNWRGTKEKASA